MVTLVLDRGANVLAVDKRDRSALHIACLYRDIDNFLVLLTIGTDVMAVDFEGDTLDRSTTR